MKNEPEKSGKSSGGQLDYARWIVLLITAKAVIVLLALAVILFFKVTLG